MKTPIIEARDICKTYGNRVALSHVSLSIYEGHIYGMIGENGAGKTTLLKIITGLAFPTSGEIALYGEHRLKNLGAKRRSIGSTIEAPALYSSYTAEKNLDIQRILVGNPDRQLIQSALKLVELEDAGGVKVKNFSMGMKQRLGIAMSLMGNPEALILDEPINGLDPKGIAELRAILQKLNQERGMTILLSSHILNELYLLASDYIIIHDGAIIETLTHTELDRKCQKYVAIKTADTAACAVVLENQLQTRQFKVMPDGLICLYDYTDDVTAVAQALHESDLLVTHIALSEQTLEEYYLSVTGGSRDV